MASSVFHSSFMHQAPERGEFAPPPPPGRLRALALALAAHAVLIAALTWGVSWNRQSTELSVEAELWSALPQQAAPRAVEAPPPPSPPAPVPPRPAQAELRPRVAEPDPREAEIALARQKKKDALQREAERQRLAEQKRRAEEARERELDQRRQADERKRQEQKLADEKRRQDAQKLAARNKEEAQQEARRLEAQRQENLRRMAGLAGATGDEKDRGNAQRSSGQSAGYEGRIRARIKPNIVFADEVSGNPTAEVEVRAAPDGTIVGRRLVKSSGHKGWDEAVLKAIDKTEVLPRDVDGRVPPTLIISFRPRD